MENKDEKKVEGLVEKAVKNGKTILELDDECAELYEMVQSFSERKVLEYTPDQLSRFATEVSVLMIRLGAMVSRYRLNANSKYIYRKFKSAKVFNRLRGDVNMKMGDADKKSIELVKSEYDDELRYQYFADLLQTFYDDCSRLVMVIQSRLSTLKNEKINSNLSPVK